MVYEKYGISKEEASARGIRMLEYVEIEAPEFAKEAREIPLDLVDYIERFDLVWSLSIEASYAERRRWNDFLAFREFLQNALDEEHEVYGYDNIDVKIETDHLGTWIKDRGRGITYEAFLLGGYDKPCHLRGRFGEGMKLGALWFAVKGHPVFIFTKDIVYKCYYSSVAKSLVVVFGRSKIYVDGTWVLIYKYYIPEEYVSKVYYKNAGFDIVDTITYSISDCDVEMPNIIMKPGNHLYVRDIFVNTFSKLLGRESYYSYNLWWVDLEPNRVQVQSTFQLDEEVAYVLSSSRKALIEFIMNSLKTENYGGHIYYYIEQKYYEHYINYPLPYDTLDIEIREELAEKLRRLGITAYAKLGDFGAVTAVTHEGGICILVPSNMVNLFTSLKSATEFVVESIRESLQETEYIDPKMLNVKARGYLRVYELIIRYLFRDVFYGDNEIDIKVAKKGRSHYNGASKTIVLVRYDLYDPHVFIHELAHAYGHVKYGNAPDLTENFQRALAEVGARLIGISRSSGLAEAISRALNGGIYAEPKSIYEYFDLSSISLDISYIHYLSKIFEIPCMFLIIANNEPYAVNELLYVIREDDIPVEEIYESKVKFLATKLEEILTDFKRGKLDTEEAVRRLRKYDITDICGWHLERIKEAEDIKIYYYDLIKDRYEYYTTIF